MDKFKDLDPRDQREFLGRVNELLRMHDLFYQEVKFRIDNAEKFGLFANLNAHEIYKETKDSD